MYFFNGIVTGILKKIRNGRSILNQKRACTYRYIQTVFEPSAKDICLDVLIEDAEGRKVLKSIGPKAVYYSVTLRKKGTFVGKIEYDHPSNEEAAVELGLSKGERVLNISKHEILPFTKYFHN